MDRAQSIMPFSTVAIDAVDQPYVIHTGPISPNFDRHMCRAPSASAGTSIRRSSHERYVPTAADRRHARGAGSARRPSGEHAMCDRQRRCATKDDGLSGLANCCENEARGHLGSRLVCPAPGAGLSNSRSLLGISHLASRISALGIGHAAEASERQST